MSNKRKFNEASSEEKVANPPKKQRVEKLASFKNRKYTTMIDPVKYTRITDPVKKRCIAELAKAYDRTPKTIRHEIAPSFDPNYKDEFVYLEGLNDNVPSVLAPLLHRLTFFCDFIEYYSDIDTGFANIVFTEDDFKDLLSAIDHKFTENKESPFLLTYVDNALNVQDLNEDRIVLEYDPKYETKWTMSWLFDRANIKNICYAFDDLFGDTYDKIREVCDFGSHEKYDYLL